MAVIYKDSRDKGDSFPEALFESLGKGIRFLPFPFQLVKNTFGIVRKLDLAGHKNAAAPQYRKDKCKFVITFVLKEIGNGSFQNSPILQIRLRQFSAFKSCNTDDLFITFFLYNESEEIPLINPKILIRLIQKPADQEVIAKPGNSDPAFFRLQTFLRKDNTYIIRKSRFAAGIQECKFTTLFDIFRRIIFFQFFDPGGILFVKAGLQLFKPYKRNVSNFRNADGDSPPLIGFFKIKIFRRLLSCSENLKHQALIRINVAIHDCMSSFVNLRAVFQLLTELIVQFQSTYMVIKRTESGFP